MEPISTALAALGVVKQIVSVIKEAESTIDDVSSLGPLLGKYFDKKHVITKSLKETNNKLILESKKDFKFDVIEKLNQLMNDTFGTEKYELIKIRLDAFYHMNKIKPETWYDESKEDRMNIIGQNGNEGTHYVKDRAENLMRLKKK